MFAISPCILCTFEPVQAFENLRWCISSTPLLVSGLLQDQRLLDARWCTDQLQRHKHWLEAVAKDNDSIAQAVDDPAPGRIPLGKRFERYLHFWFEQSPFFELKAANLQVNQDKRTIGEFDFIVEDIELNTTMHIEVACKFYLGVNNRRERADWVGPSGRDRLDLKTDTLKRQLELARREEGRRALEAIGVRDVQAAALVKGYFFHHYTKLLKHQVPHGGHPAHNAGWWAYERELNHLFSGDGTWVILPKSDWLANVHLNLADDRLLSARLMVSACREYFASAGRSVMVAQLDRVGDSWVELSRGCIVHNHWPNYNIA